MNTRACDIYAKELELLRRTKVIHRNIKKNNKLKSKKNAIIYVFSFATITPLKFTCLCFSFRT